jgi:ribosome recycling factor
MIKDVMDDAEVRMGKAIDALRRDLATIRTGRASPSLVERLPVDY